MDVLKAMLGDGASKFLHRAVRGIDPGTYQSQPKSHSVSSEVTFERDRKDLASLKKTLLELSQQVMSRLIQDNMRSKTPFIKLRFHDFTTTNAQKTLRHWLTSSSELYHVALELLKKRWDGHTPVRLIGLGVSGVVKDQYPEQPELWQDSDSKKKKVEEAVIGIKKKWGGAKLTRASLLGHRMRGYRPTSDEPSPPEENPPEKPRR
jgi:DNA polymerase-4